MKKRTKLILFLLVIFFNQDSWCQAPVKVWLSDLDVTKATIGWGTPGKDVSCMGNPIILNGVNYEKGFGTHANSVLMVKLGRKISGFHAIVGINDEEKDSKGSVIFRILGDRKVLWESSKLVSGGKAEVADINSEGVDTLMLIADGTGDGISYDHADWADAYFTGKGYKPVTISPAVEKAVILTPKSSPAPKINGPKIYGVRPGHDFIFRIPVTGKRPIAYAIKGLPEGLKLDSKTGIITGKANTEGRFETTVTASNSLGKAVRKFTIVVGKQIALTPPLGWNSWNCFACAIDQDKVKAAADALEKSGLADHGWSYINIDDCWMVRPNARNEKEGGIPRNENGNMNTNKKFPDIKGLTDYVHGKGLKIGIYSGPGPLTCAGFTACYQHEEQDAKQFADWGFDYLKYDWCSYSQIAPKPSLEEMKKPYLVMRDALARSGRDIVYSLCQYGMGDVWEWGAEVDGNCWRTTGDITDNWSSMENIGFNQSGKEKFAGPGHWNDPDMLIVGKVGWGPQLHPTRLTPNEQYTHISLWALLASPLLIGCDMTQLDAFTYSLLTNDEVLDINQDPLGKQAGRIFQKDGIEIWAKDMEDGSKAVGLFNRGMQSAPATLAWENLIISGKYTIRDVWSQKDIGKSDQKFTAVIPPHGVKLIRIYK